MKRKLTVLAGLFVVTVCSGLSAQTSSAYVFFQAPSKNIGCILSKKGARCDIIRKSWRPPPKPADCITDWGYGLAVARRGKGHFFCAGNSAIAGKTLGYKKTIRRGRFRCKSMWSGMRCVNVRNGHGFKLSREVARRF